MPITTRRALLKSAPLMGAGLAAGHLGRTATATAMSNPQMAADASTFGHTDLFMDIYHRRITEIYGELRGELGHIGKLAGQAATVIRNGGRIWTSMNIGHMPRHEQADTRRGASGDITTHGTEGQIDFDMLKAGDMVFTTFCNQAVKAARDRGVYVVAVTVNYVDNEFRPVGFSHPNPDGLMLADVSNDIIDSKVPYQQGLVQAPEIPEMTICPSSSNCLGAVHWMLTAEIDARIAGSRTGAAAYLDILTGRVAQLAGHRDRLRETAAVMAERIRSGGRWFVRSIEHPGLQSELTGVASGPMIVNWGDWDATKDRNVMLISAISPAHPEELALARKTQAEGGHVIAIGPAGGLIDTADTGFDTHSPEDGVIESARLGKPICPTNGITANILQQMLCAQWTDEMVRRGSVPFYWLGFYQVGGKEYDDGVRLFFERQGY